jgi:hypothetical protein
MTTKFLMSGLVTAATVAMALFAFVPASHADDLGGPASNTEAQQEAYRGYGYARPSYSYARPSYSYSYGYARPSYGYSYGYARPSYGYSYGYARPSYGYGYGYRNW